ncbi:hypothetical protein RND81_14G207700 [Saponaria officinalis]|uniref:Multiple myeloma tumor-associated protein 2-like N-terminal domain-containing protein n=1 Tax=Saponaria officinalis TaxID=3572 RepID=A0AAW1GSL2_SAPOF
MSDMINNGTKHKSNDLCWYSKDTNSRGADQEALKAEIQRIKEEEEQSMREGLGLAPKRSNNRPQGNRLDKHEFVKRGSTAEDLGAGHADAAQVQGLGFARAPRISDPPISVPPGTSDVAVVQTEAAPEPSVRTKKEESDEDVRQKKRKHNERKRERHDERKHEKHEERECDKHERREKRHSRDSKDKRKS